MRHRRGTTQGVVCLTALAVLGATVGAALAAPTQATVQTRASAAALPVGGVPWTWGGNSFGELGSGTTQSRPAPAPVSGLTDVVDLHGGREHVASLRSDGTVWVWGSNQQGQLGLGGGGNRSTPTRVPGLSGVVAVETGHNSSLALLADGTVRSWGLNADGQLGDGTTTTRQSPVTVSGLDDAVAIAAGRNMAYAVRADGTVVGWGRNDEGQLGDGSRTRRLTPVRVGSLTGVTTIAAGRDHGLAVRSDGTVWSWGSNDYGQVGNGTTTDQATPVQVTTGVAEVIAGAHHSYARRSDGTVVAWGRNYRANLGDGTTTTRTRPVSVRGLASVVSIGSGRDTGMAVLADGRVMAWGNNEAGQVGDGSTANRTTPVLVPGVTGAVLAGGGGADYAVVVVADGDPPAPQDPVAAFAPSCTGLTCSFDARGSTDPDGELVDHVWDFGDGDTGTGEQVTHAYDAAGSYPVRLTVTDDDGASDTLVRDVVVDSAPPAAAPVWRAGAATSTSTARPSVRVPTGVQRGDRLLLVLSANRAATLTTPAGWTLFSTISDGTDVRSWVLTRAATAADAGSTLTLSLDATSKAAVVLLAYDGAGPPSATPGAATGSATTTSHVAPAATVAVAGSRVVRYYVDKASAAHSWSLPSSLSARAATNGTGGGLLAAAAGDAGPVAAGSVPALAATSGTASSKAIAWTLVLPPG